MRRPDTRSGARLGSHTGAGPLSIATSVGVAYSTGTIDAISLVALADQALYAAKSAGRNTYRLRTARSPAAAGA
jgi:PleD family two-component response regulator